MTCDPADVGLKSLFLGPQSENAPWVRDILKSVLDSWFEWRQSLYSDDGRAISDADQRNPEFVARTEELKRGILEAVERFRFEIPKFSPRYIGHMFSEISLPALMGHVIALLHNPNNISGEASRVGLSIEREAIESLMTMLDWVPQAGAGHFTSGGSVANIEALTRARRRVAIGLALGAARRSDIGIRLNLLDAAHRIDCATDEVLSEEERRRFSLLDGNPWEVGASLSNAYGAPYGGGVILVPAHRHYSWDKAAELLGLGREALWRIPLAADGRLSVAALRESIERAWSVNRPVIAVVSVAGTTELGTIDPIAEVAEVIADYRSQGRFIWHHVDGAYGGFFRAVRENASELFQDAARDLAAIEHADSVTLDPHKLGYVPYSCGALLIRDRRHYPVWGLTIPYLALERAKVAEPQTLEGSRSAAGALATWLISRCVGFGDSGYGRIFTRTVRARQKLQHQLELKCPSVHVPSGCHTNILAFTVAEAGDSLDLASARTQQIYERFAPERNPEFFVSKTRLLRESYGPLLDTLASQWHAPPGGEALTLIRACLMNPFFDSKEPRVNYLDRFVDVVGETLSLR